MQAASSGSLLFPTKSPRTVRKNLEKLEDWVKSNATVFDTQYDVLEVYLAFEAAYTELHFTGILRWLNHKLPKYKQQLKQFHTAV